MRRKVLDGHTFDSTLSTLADIIDIDAAVLLSKLRDFHPVDWPEHPPDVLWRHIVGEPKHFDDVYWFHLSRTTDPLSFRNEGILPLGECVDALWTMIFELIGDRQSETAKRAFRSRVESGRGGHSTWLYHTKINDVRHWGPWGILVREMAFRPHEVGNHDYLGAPEIVEDICDCYSEWHGDNLLADFVAASKSCIVKFRGGNLRTDAPPAALMYLWQVANESPPSFEGNTCFDGEGLAVFPENIIDIEIID